MEYTYIRDIDKIIEDKDKLKEEIAQLASKIRDDLLDKLNTSKQFNHLYL